MKILFISHNFFPLIGGIEVNSEILATAFSEAGHDVRMVTWTPDAEGTKFSFEIVREPGLITLLRLHNWAELIFENNPSLRLSWPNILFSRPHVVAVRTMINRNDGTSKFQNVFKKKWLKQAKYVIAVSEAIRIKCFLNAVVIGNPYRVSQFKIQQKILRSKHFVFMGRLVSEKGVDLAIRAVHHFNKRKTEKFTLSIIGEGQERHLLEELTMKLNMEDYIFFKGTLCGEDLTNCLNEHRFILIPSRCEEAFGNVALEGMACGCIPIVSDSGGLPDAIGPAGLTFKCGNLKSLIATMERLINESKLQSILLEKAKQHLNSHHPKVIAKQYLEVVDSAASAKKFS